MVAGSVLRQTGKRNASDLGGLATAMPITAFCAVIGAMAIAAVPLVAGFISKSVIIEAAAKQHLAAPWVILMAASAGAVLHAGLRLPWFVFFNGPTQPATATDPPQHMRIAMVLAAALLVVVGLVPDGLYALLPYQVAYVPYSTSHILTQLQLLGFAALAFYLMRDWLRPKPGVTLDLDWFYRRPGKWLARGFNDVTGMAWYALVSGVNERAAWVRQRLHRHHGPDGTFGRSWPTGTMALWTTVLLGAFLIIAAL